MRARLLLSAAVATLSLCISPGYAQNAGHDRDRGEAARPGQAESVTPHRKPDEQGAAEKGAREQRSEAAKEQNRERAETKGARESEKQGLAEPEKGRHGAKEEERRGAAAEAAKNEAAKNAAKSEAAKSAAGKSEAGKNHEAAQEKKHEKHGAKEENRDRNPAGTSAQHEHDRQDRTGQMGASPEERTGAAATHDERRAGQDEANRPGGMERRGVNETGPQKNRGAATTPSGENRETFGRADSDQQERAGREAQERGGREALERGGVRLSERQQSRVRDIIDRRGFNSVSRSEFDVRIGAVVPQNVQFYPLPPEVVAIVPQYRGYDFVRVEDQIVIVDPGDRQVVAMLGDGGAPPAMYGYEERGGGYARERYGSAQRDEGRYGARRERRGEAYGYAPRVRLDTRQERALYRGVMSEARTNLRQVCVRVGDRVPEFVDIEPVPRNIAAETPDVERYDYFVLNDQVVLVDPDSRVVVDIVQEPR